MEGADEGGVCMKLTAPTVVLALAIAAPLGSAILYAESTYMKVTAAEQQYREYRLDGLYRDLEDCDKAKAKLKKGEAESGKCQRVRTAIEILEGQKKEQKK